MLVAAGASLTMRDANGLTPMMIAFQVEDNDLATYLESEFFHSLLTSFGHYPVSLEYVVPIDYSYMLNSVDSNIHTMNQSL